VRAPERALADLLLIEYASQAERAASAQAGTRIVALSPEAMNALDRHGVQYRTPESYLSTAELNALGVSSYDSVLDYCRRLDAWLEAQWPELSQAGIHAAAASQYDFKILSDTLVLRAAELQALVKEERPARILAFPTHAEPLDSSLAFRRESAYARVLPVVAAEAGVVLEWSSRTAGPAAPYKEKRGLRQLVPLHWRQRLAHLESSGFGVLRQPPSGSLNDAVLLLNLTPDIRRMVNDPTAPWRFVHWSGAGLPLTIRPLGIGGDLRRLNVGEAGPLPNALAAVETPPVNGLVPDSLEPLARSRVLHFVHAVVPAMLAAARRADLVVDHYRPQAAVAGILSDPEARGAAARVRRLGVPLVLVQHGGSYGYLDHPVHYHNDLYHADSFLTYGDGVASYLRDKYAHRSPCAEIHAVGSPALAAVIARQKGRSSRAGGHKPVVLYVATCLMGQRFYAPHYRSCEYFGLLADAARALDRARDVEPILKIHQRGDNCLNPIADYCRRHAPRVKVVGNGTLDALLDEADLVMIDLPSTPLLETLARRMPALVFCDERVFHISPAARPVLEAAVRLETDRGRFIAAIAGGAALARELTDLPRSNDFLERFGTRPDAARDAAEALAAVCRRAGALAL
jgi:hypothetical protein